MLGKVHFNIWVNYTSARDLTNYLSDNIPNQIKKYKDDEIRHCAHMQCHSFVGATHADPGRPDFISNWPMVGLQSPITSLLIQKTPVLIDSLSRWCQGRFEKAEASNVLLCPHQPFLLHDEQLRNWGELDNHAIKLHHKYARICNFRSVRYFGVPSLWYVQRALFNMSSIYINCSCRCNFLLYRWDLVWSLFMERKILSRNGHLLAKYIRRPKKERRRWWTVVTLELKRTETKQQ